MSDRSPAAAPGAGAGLPPPVPPSVGPLGWVRERLFPTRLDGAASIVLLVVVAWASLVFVEWALTEARWGVITSNMRLFLVGLYPLGEMHRVWLALVMLSVLAGLSAGTWRHAVRTLAMWLAAGEATVAVLMFVSGFDAASVAATGACAALVIGTMLLAGRRPVRRQALVLAWLLSFPATLVLLHGVPGTGVVAIVGTNSWGGLLLTLMLAIVAIAVSFPFGVLLALGRRSRLPAVSWMSTAFIEIVRGVPLVTIIFLADIMLPLLAGDTRIDRVLRAMGGLTIFTAAYLAENVRGGLQSIPRGQYEAAQALGLNSLQLNLHIVLPQALRAVIPANVGLFISLLKDTTLVVIVGLLELLGIGRAVLAQPEWLGASFEVYVFVAVVFFVLCVTMSRASYRLEAAWGVGVR
jgi:general L-amino acid transport system permease protein